ncbi:hypothetical protein K440DRAFT_642522 [Wilcoxina mikolae CBS 423.85]|nr:hypothetical protein K440DRAFT_642522 [Wilcoxina mikolae CBS 423.85]
MFAVVVTTRYPDLRANTYFSRFVWYDIPGAGTLNRPSKGYFNEQGLFIFDGIILVYDIRFTEIDAYILENCQRWGIPTLIVRSKADQHIQNMMSTNYAAVDEYRKYRQDYIAQTWSDLEKHLSKFEATKFPFFIVSAFGVYELFHGLGQALVTQYLSLLGGQNSGRLQHEMIDELQLMHTILDKTYF